MNGDPLESNFVVDVMEKKIRVHRDALTVIGVELSRYEPIKTKFNEMIMIISFFNEIETINDNVVVSSILNDNLIDNVSRKVWYIQSVRVKC